MKQKVDFWQTKNYISIIAYLTSKQFAVKYNKFHYVSNKRHFFYL